MTTLPAAGWYPDPADPSRVRWWDGAAWSDQTAAFAPPAATFAAPPPATGYASQYAPGGAYSPVGRPTGRSRLDRLRYENHASLVAIGFSAAYVALALVVHFVLIGIVPVIWAVRAVQRRERLAPLAAVAAACAVGGFLLVLRLH